MRACACVTASRLCVRTVLCSSAFLLVPSSPSTDSAADRSALFAGFAGTIDESDFFAPFIIGYGLRPSRCGPGNGFPGQNEDLPVPAQEMCVHAQGLMTTRGGQGPRDDGPVPVAFCMPRHRPPELHCFRRSIPRLYAPLSTLRVLPRGSIPRMTRGQCGSLLLYCDGLSPSTSCRSSRRTAAQYLARGLPCERFTAALASRASCITRGRGGWLNLPRGGLPPPILCQLSWRPPLRGQLNVLRRKSPQRLGFTSIDRLVFAGLYRLAPGVLDAFKVGQPEDGVPPPPA